MEKTALATALEPVVPAEEIAAAEETTTTESGKPATEQTTEQQQPEKEQEQQKVVPHGAFHEEREKRKAAQQQLQQRDQQIAVLNDRFNQLFAAQQQTTQQQNQPQFRDPEKDPDPLGAMQHNMAIVQQRNDDLMRAMQERGMREQQASQQAQQAQRLVDWGQSKAAEYRQEAPDWDDAYKHIREVRVGELMALGYQGQQLSHALQNDEFNVIATAYQQGRNPAEVVYAMAQAAGYKRKAAGAEQRIENIQKGQQAAKTVGNGAASAGWPTPEQIAEMSETQFEDLKAKLAKSGKALSDVL